MIVYVVMRIDLDAESSIEGIFADYLDAVAFRKKKDAIVSWNVTFEIEEWEVK